MEARGDQFAKEGFKDLFTLSPSNHGDGSSIFPLKTTFSSPRVALLNDSPLDSPLDGNVEWKNIYNLNERLLCLFVVKRKNFSCRSNVNNNFPQYSCPEMSAFVVDLSIVERRRAHRNRKEK